MLDEAEDVPHAPNSFSNSLQNNFKMAQHSLISPASINSHNMPRKEGKSLYYIKTIVRVPSVYILGSFLPERLDLLMRESTSS